MPGPATATNQSVDDKILATSGFAEHVDQHRTTPPPKARTTVKMAVFAIFIALAAFSFGFDAGYSGIVLAMPAFNRTFGTCHTLPNGEDICVLNATRQSINTIYQLFAGVGTVLAALMSKWVGRRTCLQIGCLWVVVGAAGMLGTSDNFAAYVVCHCIEAIGLGHFVSMAPVYGVECVTPQKRGMLISLYSVGSSLGSVAIASVCLGTSGFETNWAWQTPIICQIPLAILYAGGLFMFSESPRWLMLQGKEDEARQSFASFYDLDSSSSFITTQMEQVRSAIEIERSITSTTSWTEIFDKQNIRRTAIACAITASVAFSGLWFIVQYASLFLQELGYANKFLITLLFSIALFSGTTISPFALEYLGRRLSMLLGYSIMAICMLIFSATSSALGISNTNARNVLIAFIIIWSIAFGMLIGNTQWVASAEMHSVRLRSYGQSCAALISIITSFASSFWTPYMINKEYGNMGTNVGYFYFGLTLVDLVVIFFVLPETGQLSLEAIDDIFSSNRQAWKTSLKKNKLLAKSE